MAIFRQVQCEFWKDGKVIEEMTPEDKFFYLYLLTNPHTTQIGIYQLPKKVMAFEMGYSTESINSLVDRFENHHKLIKYNEDTREIAILNWGKYNLSRGGKPMEDCVFKELQEVKDISLIPLVGEKVANDKLKEIFIKYFNDTSTSREEDTDDTSKKKDDENNLEIEKQEICENAHSDDTCTSRQREVDNNNKNNNKNNNTHTKKEIEEVMCVLDKKITFEESKKLLKISNGDIEIIKDKYEVAKVNGYKTLMGFMTDAIREDWQMPKSQEGKANVKKTSFHNFNGRTSNYTPEELEEMVLNKHKNKDKN